MRSVVAWVAVAFAALAVVMPGNDKEAGMGMLVDAAGATGSFLESSLNVSHRAKGTIIRLWRLKENRCPSRSWFLGTVDRLPSSGVLKVNKTVLTDANKAQFSDLKIASMLVYVPNTPFPPSTSFPVRDSFTVKNVPIERCNANGGRMGILQVNVMVTNSAPFALHHVYKSYHAAPRRIKFPWFDRDGNGDVTTLSILNITGGCVLATQGDKTHENLALPKTFEAQRSVTGVAFWKNHLNFDVFPPTDQKEQWHSGQADAKCVVSYTVEDRYSRSNVGTLTVKAVAEETGIGAGGRLHAYDADYFARPGTDEYIQISLRSAATGGLSDHLFYIDELPLVGKLFVRGLSGTFNATTEINTTGLVNNLGRQRRSSTQLYYQPPRSVYGKDTDVYIKWKFSIGKLGTPAQPKVGMDQVSNQATVRIKLIAAGNQIGPVCGITTLDPVYPERPFIKIPFNYSVSDGSEVSRVVLYGSPRYPLGDFYVTSNSFVLPADGDFGENGNTNVKVLQVGNAFNDRKQQVFFKVRPAFAANKKIPPFGTTQRFKIRVINYRRQSCVSWVFVHYRQHDAVAKVDANKTISSATFGTAIRNEVALVGKYTLLPMRGLANRSLNDQKKIRGLRLVSLPTRGELYSVHDAAPLLTNMYGTYCRKVNCADHQNIRLGTNAVVERTIFDGEEALDGVHLLRVLYKSKPHLSEKEMAKGDSFSYHFLGEVAGVQSTWLQQVNILFRDGYSKVLEFSYDKPKKVNTVASGSGPVDQAQQVMVALQISNVSSGPNGQAVEIRVKDSYRRHSFKRRFKLYQLKEMDGTRAVPGAELMASEKYITAKGGARLWVVDPENKNRIVFAPSMHTHRQRFSFRVRIWTLDGKGVPVEDAYEEYRVRVQRHNNAPEWDKDEPCRPKVPSMSASNGPQNRVNCVSAENNTVMASKDFIMTFSVVDLDDDAITFTMPKIPKYGSLDYTQQMPSGWVRTRVQPGQRVRLAKSTTAFKGIIFLVYSHKFSTAKTAMYPLKDSFTIYGSDGGAHTSTLKVNLRVINDNARFGGKDLRQKRVRDSVAVGVAVMVMLCALIMAAVVIVKRRQTMKKRYMALPVVTGQPQAGAGPGSEMTPVA